MARVPQTRAELERHLRNQMGFLQASAEAYDAGQVAEADRLATTLRVLLHHRPPNTHALLEQLGLLTSLSWFDTGGQIDPNNTLGSHVLVTVRLKVSREGRLEGLWLPRLGEVEAPSDVVTRSPGVRPPGLRLPFETWWNDPVVKDDDGNMFSRRDLTLKVANQDGGAHVDPGLQDDYHGLSRSNSMAWRTFDPAGERALDSPVGANLRQIAYEVEVTLADFLPPPATE